MYDCRIESAYAVVVFVEVIYVYKFVKYIKKRKIVDGTTMLGNIIEAYMSRLS